MSRLAEEDEGPITIECFFQRPFSSRLHKEKLEIVKNGRPRPALPTLQSTHREKNKVYTRHFLVSTYEKIPWLTGSASLNKLYCWPCLLFGVEKSVWTRDGYDKLNAMTNAIQKHDRAQNHISCFVALKCFGSERTDIHRVEVEKKIVEEHNDKVRKFHELLRRMIDVICFLTRQESFQKKFERNKGNYFEETLQLISDYDPSLKACFESATGFGGRSNRTEEDLIDAIARVVIRSEVDVSLYASIMLDVTGEAQLSIVLRFVTVDGVTCERLVRFDDVIDNMAAGEMCERVALEVARELKLEDKLVAHACDGAAVKAAHIPDLCKRVEEAVPRALFVHCHSHDLNSILEQSLNTIRKCRDFFQFLNGLVEFFSNAPKRTCRLVGFMWRRLPNVMSCRWPFLLRSVKTVHQYRHELIEFFEDLIENCDIWDDQTIVKAQWFLTSFISLDVCFQLNVFSKIFTFTDVLQSVLHTKSFDIGQCGHKVVKTNEAIREAKVLYDNVWGEVLRETRGDMDEPPRKTRRRNDNQKDTYRSFYFEIIDNVTTQIEQRFSLLKSVEYIGMLNPDYFTPHSKKFPEHLLSNLQDAHTTMFDFVRLKNELTILYRLNQFRGKPPHKLLAYMCDKGLTECMPELYRLCHLVLTIPCSLASAERSFSALSRIRRYTRANQRGRLDNLSLLTIEKCCLAKLRNKAGFYDDVISDFTQQKDKMDFAFKQGV